MDPLENFLVDYLAKILHKSIQDVCVSLVKKYQQGEDIRKDVYEFKQAVWKYLCSEYQIEESTKPEDLDPSLEVRQTYSDILQTLVLSFLEQVL